VYTARVKWGVAVVLVLALAAGQARAQSPDVRRTVVYRFTPTARAQIALWLESVDGTRFVTLALTQATAKRGIGNRPGASQMNSGYHWPYGRREGVLPVWAHRRAGVPGAAVFPRVIFQDRRSEGDASQAETTIPADSSPDAYFCLSFNLATTQRDALDAVSCASAFNGDKGRFITPTDVQSGYGEPYQQAGVGMLRALDLTSLYPPRTDVVPCRSNGCADHPDVGKFASETMRVMPNLDAISMATPSGDVNQVLAFEVPGDWPDGDGLAFLEINTEGDYDASYNDMLLPTPTLQANAWDTWAMNYGYPFRGQPSVVFRVGVRIGSPGSASERDPIGYAASLDGTGSGGGDIRALDSRIANDPMLAPGSGADRLRLGGGNLRLIVETTVTPAPRDAGGGPDDGEGGTNVSRDAGAVAPDAAADAATPAVCAPGRTVTCACVGGTSGAQTCNSDGKSYGICQCPTLGSRSRGCRCDVSGAGGGAAEALPLLLALLLVRRPRRRR